LALDLPRVVREIRSKISERGIGLVHAHLGFSELLAGVAVPKEIPLVASRRGRNLGYEDRSWFRLLEDASHRRVALLLCNSEELASFTLAHDGSPPPVVVIPNGVDLERFALTPFASGPPTVSVVANLLSYKRHDLFLRAFALVTRWTPEARATLVGDGAERGRLEMLADDLGLSNSVLFAGRLDDPRPFIAEAHAVALTSIHEGLPNALLEAMAMGRPTVATPVGGIPELVRDGNEGLLAEARPEAVAEALIRVLGDRDRAEAMGRAARARAEAFGWESVVLRTEDAYRLVLRGEVLPRARRVA
jgi:glycosyltransferase involved in cell wall biosynthesis